MAMKAVAGMEYPLLEACLVRNGGRIAFRHHGAIVDPIRRQLLFDFEHGDRLSAASEVSPLCRPNAPAARGVQDRFLSAVQAEEAGEKQRAIRLYEEILSIDPRYAARTSTSGPCSFTSANSARAEEFYRRATEANPGYVLAFFDLGNVLDELERLDESIAAYQHAVSLAPRYADAHYNLALAYERKGQPRAALRHWQVYARLDSQGPWADHARGQIRKLLERECLSIVTRATRFLPPRKGLAALALVPQASV